ncbi:MAG: DUF2793 domain-containing protein [Verrucomicrobiales bacterium]|nr:DUF2793 domain-containing protein [Verrucomicrobiales bacterium]
MSATKKSVRFAVIPAKEWAGEAPFLARARDGTTGPAEMKTSSNSAPPSPPRAQLALAVAALLWWAATPTAQGAGTWRVWRAGDGLAESMTRSVTVSPRGNVWVRHGEVDAISLLDGYEVRRLPSPGGAGQRVYQSRAGLIWTTDSAGLLQYAANQWRPHPIEPFQREVASSPLQALRQPPILPTSQDRVLVLLPDELLEYRGMSRSVTVVLRADETSLGRFLDVTATPDAGCWISCESGLMRLAGPLRQLDPGMPRLEHLLPGELAVHSLRNPVVQRDGGVSCVGEEPSQSRRVAVHFDGVNWSRQEIPGENPRFAWHPPDSEEWFGMTFARLVRVLPDQTTAPVADFQAGQYFDFAMEPDGAFWIASSEGLARCAPPVWRPGPAADTGEVMGGLLAPDGTLWFALRAGLLRQQDEEWRITPWPRGLEPEFQAGDRMYRLPDGRLVIPAPGGIWTGAPDGAGFREIRHPRGHRVRQIVSQEADGTLNVVVDADDAEQPAHLEAFDGDAFRSGLEMALPEEMTGDLFFLEESANGDIWAGGSRGIARWRDGTWRRFGPADGFTDDGAICWLERPNGRIWCGGLDKVSEFDGKRWSVVRGGLDRVRMMQPASDGSVWLATGDGLHRQSGGGWNSVKADDGLPSDLVHVVVEDSRHRVWVGTSRGLVRHVSQADVDPPVTLTIGVEKVVDPESDSTLRFVFRGRDKWRFTPDERLVYSHRVDEGEWSSFNGNNSVVIRDLPSGRHRLEVRAMDRNWNAQVEPTVTEFAVVLPWFHDPRVVAAGSVALLAVVALIWLAINRHFSLRRSYATVERQVAVAKADLERATEALVQSQKMTALGTLTAGIAHDFNNILSIIRGSAQIVAANLDDRPKVLARLDRIEAGVDQASSVIQAMLGFSRASERHPAPCETNAMIDETVRLLGDRFQRELILRRELARDLPPVMVVRDLVQQILLNLILNAADAMNNRGEILLVSRRHREDSPLEWSLAPAPSSHGFVEILIRDQGCGIPQAIRARIFEPFFSTKPFSSRHGTGLGLYMVYEFAREMGLGLRVESLEQKGSTFIVVLPIEVTRPAAPRPA